jgi:enediyne biosynthesis protein E4
MRISVASLILALGLVAACTSGTGNPGASRPSESARDAGAPSAAEPEWFTDRAAEFGLDAVHHNGASGHFYYPEILGPGVALFDYDNDGDLDVYIVQGRSLGAGEAPAPPAQAQPLRGRLYRNDLQVRPDGSRVVHFTDVTEPSGIDARGYGLGVAAADIDNDGWVDLYLMNFGANQMFHNNGDGTFADVTKQSGTDNQPEFGVSAAFLDYDRDGWLDLYVGNNVNYSLKNDTPCPNMAGARDYCPPQIYGGRADRLYHNLGHGRFVDVTSQALVGGKFGPALGVTAADFNGDGWIDIFVANDGEDDLLWLNQRNGTFKEVALASGVAVTGEGKAEASMGVDAGDFDNDGDEDLIMTELTGQGSNLYLNDGRGMFRDVSALSGLGGFTRPSTGWGTAWFDFDNDGWLDTLSVNGTIIAQEGHRTQAFPYDQKKILLRNLGNGRFENVSSRAGRAFDVSEAGRGAAFGDIDNDGDIDVLIGNDAGPVRLLVNNIGNRNHWVGLRLIGGKTPRDLLGARVAVVRKDAPTLWRRSRSDGSYGSANDPRVLVGLGKSAERPQVRVQWPDGRTEEWSDVDVDRWTTLKEGVR